MGECEPAVGLSHGLPQADEGSSSVEEDGAERGHGGRVREAAGPSRRQRPRVALPRGARRRARPC
jgi:hypothetical protein